ncbi:MAG TPA: alpha-glucan family phosphorylase [Steroidobacteraceae bacterium]|jgi:starch phosphorylase
MTSKRLKDISADVERLRHLALDLGWSWNHAADVLWRELDPELWSRTHNPWVVMQTVSLKRLAEVLASADFKKCLDQIESAAATERKQQSWFQKRRTNLAEVAYFSMEFMLSEGLPIYSGGLGNVAGDQLKAASDLGVPVVGIGLLYQQGYFRQVIDSDGAQKALFPYNDPGQLPVTPLRDADGEWLRIVIPLSGRRVWLRAWQVKVGRVCLYLLDSNDAANDPADRSITASLYGGDSELRLKQELVLGIAGWRLLETLGTTPEVCHLNEGHAAFAVLERAAGFMRKARQPFDVALTVTRAGNVFTTHTAVPAGFDRFAPQLIDRYLSEYAERELEVSLHDMMMLGRCDPNDGNEPFNMAYLAMRGSAKVNGVSRLHGEVSRHIFLPLFPRWPASEIPVGHITNGVHAPSWDSEPADGLWTQACGRDRWRSGELTCLLERIRSIDDASIWRCRAAARLSLVEYVREQLARQLIASGAAGCDVEDAGLTFTPDALTLGFARRFATYKRPNLLLHDPERLARLLRNADRPVQIVIAGKAHPDDLAGQVLIREWVRFARRKDLRSHVIFLGDYDMLMAERLVGGVDLWVNTPERPWEACGTSGMKVLVNGGLNLSELDGWWAEAYAPSIGWALGDGQEHGGDSAWDANEADNLYDLLEQQVISEFYTRDERGIPKRWVARVRESMASLTPQFSAFRAVKDYTEQCYLPAADAYRRRAAEQCALGRQIASWARTLREGWKTLHIGRVTADTLGDKHQFKAEVEFGVLDPGSVRVELYANSQRDEPATRATMTRTDSSMNAENALYIASVPSFRPASDYTVRIVPAHKAANVPLEAAQVLWQH